jgi:hypothetical protein
MGALMKYFPASEFVRVRMVPSLVISVLIYIGFGVVCSLLLGLLGAIPVVGIITSIVGWLINAYCVVGIIISVLKFFDMVK